jgi:gamma-glutamyl-gamma-aminobutyrate hydrolase PuuD
MASCQKESNVRLVSAIYHDWYPFDKLALVDEVTSTISPEDLRAGDILVTWGGADISPSLYHKKNCGRTGAGERPSRRDTIEWDLMTKAKELGIPIIGVCRGAQMLCALSGGFLVQDVNNHSGHHAVQADGGVVEFTVNSIHHQMMYPFDVKHEMWAYTRPLSDYHWDETGTIQLEVEPEFVYFPEVKGFAIQWHPEMMSATSEATKFILDKIERTIRG